LSEGSAADAARDLGQGWKVNPYVVIEPGETFMLGKIDGPGVIRHIWMTVTGDWRSSILRMRWDGEGAPSVEVPVGDFFAQGWGRYAHINSLPVSVNPGSGFNSFWAMPFRKHAELTLTNTAPDEIRVYYQIDYALTAIPADAAYFHARFRRVNPLPYKEVFTIVDGIRGKGHYVGTYLAHGANSPGWWGEGEVKFYIDGDEEFPTIAGTGEEDYFLGSYSYSAPQPDGESRPTDFTAPFAGYHQIVDPDSDLVQRRFGQYRWHIPDPIRFDHDLKVTIQSLGWQSGGRYLPLQDDLAAVAYWYQTEPHQTFPPLPDREALSISWTAPLNHLGKLGKIRLEHRPDRRYNQDVRALLDGKTGSSDPTDGRWLGFEGNDLVAIVDLQSIRAVQEIAIRFLQD
ncbi:MAG: glycoside hydrolase family 172 protein, partial [Actinomycetes bacterium]